MSHLSESSISPADTPSSPLEASAPSGTCLRVKRLIKNLIPSTGESVLSDDSVEPPVKNATKDRYADYAEYAIVVRRKIHQQNRGSDIPTITTKVIIGSESMLRAARDVMKHVQQLSWNVRPFKVDPELLLTYLPLFRAYLVDLRENGTAVDKDQTAGHVSFLVKFLETEYATTLQKIENLTSHGEITFDLLWAILVPGSIIFTSCKTTSVPRAVRLLRVRQEKPWMDDPFWRLSCEYVDANEDSASAGQPFGLATMEHTISTFDGVEKITELSAYPIHFHPSVDELRGKLIRRGHKWAGLHGVHHMHYNGLAYRNPGEKFKVDSRVMIDRRTFANAEPNYNLRTAKRRPMDIFFDLDELDAPTPAGRVRVLGQDHAFDDDGALLASPIVYGFSLTDKRWLEFSVEHVSPIKWNDDAFENLEIDPGQKELVQSLIESHTQPEAPPFDDFIEGKGLGLVFNLSGPPGVGKSLTAEAASEYLRRPLYTVGAGDLGTNADTLDRKLTKIFALASTWNAIVLIDEADVFLEARSSFDLERNAVVSVFLRQIEYFRSVLFLTTNRVDNFDPAFQSRIHISLRYDELSSDAKKKIWRAFIDKARKTPRGVPDITAEELTELSEAKVNGRQIKNAVKIGVSLANHEKEALGFKHLARAMATM